MLRSDLDEYRDIEARIKEINTTEVSDTVKGSSSDFPFVTHPVSIHGIRADAAANNERKRLIEKKNAMDQFIDTQDVRARRLLDLHYRQGLSWPAVSARTGYSMEANEKYLYRLFKCP